MSDRRSGTAGRASIPSHRDLLRSATLKAHGGLARAGSNKNLNAGGGEGGASTNSNAAHNNNNNSEKNRDNQLKDLVTNWIGQSIGNDDFLPVVRAAFDWVSHKRAMIKTSALSDRTFSPSPRSSDDGAPLSEPGAEEGDEKAQEAETRANVESVMVVLESLIAERDREIEGLCSSQYSELVSAVEALSHVKHGANEVAGAVQTLAVDLKREGEALVNSMEGLQETQELVKNVSGARAAVQASLQALQLLAEAHGLCEEGKLYQAMRAVDIIKARFLQHEEDGRTKAALAAMQQQERLAGGVASTPAAPVASASASTSSSLVASFGPLRKVLTREVQRIVEEVDRQSLAGFHEWLVVARREARAIGGLAMQHELEQMDDEDRLLLGQEALKAMLGVGEGPRDISKRLVSAGLVDQPPEDAFLPTLGHDQDSGDEEEHMPGGGNASSNAFLTGSRVLGKLDLTPLHRTMEIQRRLGKEAWFREYYLSNRRQQLAIDFKPSSETKQKEVAATFIQRPQEYMASLVGFFVVERGVHLATHGSVTDPQEIASLFASMVPTLVELLSQALDRAAGAALRTPSAEEDGQVEDEIVIVSAPQLLMVKSQIHVACQALTRRGLDTTELMEMLWNYRKKFLEILLRGAVEELTEKLFEPPPPTPPRPEPGADGEINHREIPAPLPRWLERHKIISRDAEEEEHGTLGLPKPWLLRDGLDDGARTLAQAFTKFGGQSDQRRFMNQAVLSGLSRANRDTSRFPYNAPYSDFVPEVVRVVRRSVDQSGAFFRGLVGRADVAALTRDFFLQRVLIRVVRDPIREFIQRPDTSITWAIQLSADASAILHSITAMEEHVLLTGKGVTAARCNKENAAMLSLQRHRAPAPFTSRFVRLEEYAVKAAVVDAMMVSEGMPNQFHGGGQALFRPSSKLFQQPGQPGGSQHGPLARPSMNPYSRNHMNRVQFRATALGAMRTVGHHEESDHSDAWRVLIGLATDILSTTVERMVTLAAVRIKKITSLEKYWYEETYTDRPPPKKDWRGNILPEPPSPFQAPAPPQMDLTQPPYPEPCLWPQEVEADMRDYLKQCVELLPPEQCLQVHWRFFRGCVEQIFTGWKHKDVERWSHFGVRRLHCDLGVLEALADRCQLDMVASGVYDKLGVTPKSSDDTAAAGAGQPRVSQIVGARGMPPAANAPRTLDLKDAMAEARQLVNLLLSCKPEAVLEPEARSTLYARVDTMGLYFLLDKYREPPGSTMAEMMAKFGKQEVRVAYFKKKEAEALARLLMAKVQEKTKEAQELRLQEEKLAQGITPTGPLPSEEAIAEIEGAPSPPTLGGGTNGAEASSVSASGAVPPPPQLARKSPPTQPQPTGPISLLSDGPLPPVTRDRSATPAAAVEPVDPDAPPAGGEMPAQKKRWFNKS